MRRTEGSRDRAGELGTTEEDLDTAEAEVPEPVFPDYGPDAHGYFTLDRVLGHILSAAGGAIIALLIVGAIQAGQS